MRVKMKVDMRKITMIITLMLLLMVAGCSKTDVSTRNYVFEGENEEWTGEFEFNAIEVFTEKDGKLDYENKSNDKLTITYKGELAELASVKHIEISYQANSSAGSMASEYNDGPPTNTTFTLAGGGGNSALISEDEVITVTVNLDGETQTFELVTKD